MLPPNEKLVICFAHVAYRLHQRFSALNTGVYSFAVRDQKTLENRVGEAHVLVISGLWQNGLLDRATKLRFIQAIGAGTDQFPHEELAKRSGTKTAPGTCAGLTEDTERGHASLHQKTCDLLRSCRLSVA